MYKYIHYIEVSIIIGLKMYYKQNGLQVKKYYFCAIIVVYKYI